MSYNLEGGSRTKSKATITKIFIVILQKSPSLNFIQCGQGPATTGKPDSQSWCKQVSQLVVSCTCQDNLRYLNLEAKTSKFITGVAILRLFLWILTLIRHRNELSLQPIFCPFLSFQKLLSTCWSNAGNLGNIFLIVIPALCKEKASPFGAPDVCQDIGLAYSSLSMAVSQLLLEYLV